MSAAATVPPPAPNTEAPAAVAPPAPVNPEAIPAAPPAPVLGRRSPEELHAAALAAMKEAAAKDVTAPVAEVKPDPKAEAKPPEPTKPPEPENPMRKRFEELAKAQADSRAEREGAKKELDTLTEARRFADAAKSLQAGDRLGAIRALGLTFEDLANDVLGDKPTAKAPDEPAGIKELKAELAAIREERAKDIQRQEISNDLSVLSQFAQAAGEKYELTVKMGRLPDAYQMIRDHQAATKQLPGGSADAAMEWALSAVEADEEAKGKRYLTALKLSSTLSPAGTKPEAPGPQAGSGQMTSAAPRTLTNSLAAPPPPRPSGKPSSPDELRARAREVLKTGILEGA